MNSQLAAHQDLPDAPSRLFADPFVTRVDPHLAAGEFGHLFVHRAADVDDSDARHGRQQTSRHRRPKGIFDFAQVSDDADLEIADRDSEIADLRKRFDRLIDDSRFGVEMFRQCVEAFGLENYQAAREFERLSRPFTARQIAVEVSAGQRDDQWTLRMFTMKPFNRVVAAERVQRNEQVVRLALVALRDLHAMSEASQYPRPPQRRDAVAMSRAWRRGSDNADLQGCIFHFPYYIFHLSSQESRNSCDDK